MTYDPDACYYTAAELQRAIIGELISGPRLRDESRAGPVSRELLASRHVLVNPSCNWADSVVRSPSYAYACGELTWYLAGSDDGDRIKFYAPSYEAFLVNNRAPGAYGPRLRQQLPGIIEELVTNPRSRRAVIQLYDAKDLAEGGPDVPCTLTLQFLFRGGRLHLITTMRSNDAWLGMPYDVFSFTTLQLILAAAMQVGCGLYVHQAGSLHLYEKHEARVFDWARELDETILQVESDEGLLVHPMSDLGLLEVMYPTSLPVESAWTVLHRFLLELDLLERSIRCAGVIPPHGDSDDNPLNTIFDALYVGLVQAAVKRGSCERLVGLVQFEDWLSRDRRCEGLRRWARSQGVIG